MATSGTTTDALPEKTKWDLFKGNVNRSPLTFWPVPIIIIVAIARILISDPLIDSLLNMITFIAFGVQWVGIVRFRNKANKSHFEFDEEQVVKMHDLNSMSQSIDLGTSVTFLTPHKPRSSVRRLWNKITKKRMLTLYSMGEGRSTSFTKYIVDEKQWFYLKLGGYLETSDPELLVRGREYLKDTKRITTVF